MAHSTQAPLQYWRRVSLPGLLSCRPIRPPAFDTSHERVPFGARSKTNGLISTPLINGVETLRLKGVETVKRMRSQAVSTPLIVASERGASTPHVHVTFYQLGTITRRRQSRSDASSCPQERTPPHSRDLRRVRARLVLRGGPSGRRSGSPWIACARPPPRSHRPAVPPRSGCRRSAVFRCLRSTTPPDLAEAVKARCGVFRGMKLLPLGTIRRSAARHC